MIIKINTDLEEEECIVRQPFMVSNNILYLINQKSKNIIIIKISNKFI
jgi:hypothetical protein